MPVAFLQTSFSQPTLAGDDRANGIIRGVKVMELGKLAKFAAIKEDGTRISKSITLTEAHLSALQNHASNRGVVVHLTHDWRKDIGTPSAATAEFEARIGAIKSLRRNYKNDLIGDLFLKEGKTRKDVLFDAEHSPSDIMLSAVYSFLPEDENCIPQDFTACDIVTQGAGVTALFAEDENPMPEETTPDAPVTDLLSQISAACQKDIHNLAAIKALVKSIENAQPDTESDSESDSSSDSEMDSMPDAELEKQTSNDYAGGVAAMAAMKKEFTGKLTAALAKFETAKADILIAAEAKLVAALGNNKVSVKDESKNTALFGLDKVRAAISAQLKKTN